jgi:ATP-dependent DNA ligase
LELDGKSLISLTLIERKEIVKKLLPESNVLKYCDHVEDVDVNKDSLEQANKQWDDLAKKRVKDTPPDLAIAS